MLAASLNYNASQKKTQLRQMLTYYQNSFTFLFRFSSKFFETESYSNIPTHLKMSLHYLVIYLCSKNRQAQEVIEANCYADLATRNALKYLLGKISII